MSRNDVVSLGSVRGVIVVELSHGFGEARYSMGAVTGVGSVEFVWTVDADLGVVKLDDRGVYGVRITGDSSVLADRGAVPDSIGVLPARERFRDLWRLSLGTGTP